MATKLTNDIDSQDLEQANANKSTCQNNQINYNNSSENNKIVRVCFFFQILTKRIKFVIIRIKFMFSS